MSENDKLNPAELPETAECFITVQITGNKRSVEIMREAVRDEIDLTIKFASALMGKRKPKCAVYESQVA